MLSQLSIRRAAALIASLALAACQQDGGQGPRWGAGAREQQIPAVEAVEVLRGSLPLEERLAGSVVARNQTEIFPEQSGRIVEVLVNNGDRVEAGAPLVRLRATEFEERLQQALAGLKVAEARLQQAQADHARAAATLQRMETIAARNLASAAELDVARADALSAEAQVALMQAELQQARSLVEERRSALDATIVRAPVTGVVGGRNAEVGQLATTSNRLFVIGVPSEVRVEITLTQRMLGYIDVGTPVEVLVDAEGEDTIAGRISRISPFLHQVTRTTQAEIDLGEHGGRLRPGMFVTVDVLYGESELAALVPNSAIYRHPRDGREGVFVAALPDGPRNSEVPADSLPARSPLDPEGPVAIQFMPVRIIARGRQSAAIEGVEPGQWVVTVGHHLLTADEVGRAIVQPTPWDHIMRLQQMQTRDLLDLIQTRQGSLEAERQSLN